jgi:hypothetical protein
MGALLVLSALVSPAAAAQQSARDWFAGTAVVPPGQASPVQVDPHDITVRADGAIGIGYTYRAAGQAMGELPGTFSYLEHGYLFFKDPTNPKTMVGSKFVSGVFTLTPEEGGALIHIADTAPEKYTSGIQTVVDKLGPRATKELGKVLGQTGPLTYGWFTFTNEYGTFTGYATPDFTRFIIPITFTVR